MSSIQSVGRGFRIHLDNIASDVFKEWQEDVDEELTSWYSSLRVALSDRIPNGQRHRLRRDRSRLFPFYNNSTDTGDLRDAFGIEPSSGKKTKSSFKYTSGIWIDWSNRQLAYTNSGLPKPKTAEAGAWVHWADDVFGNKNRGQVKAIKHVFDKLSRKKRGL